jgi:hypothetical protein
MVTRRILVVSMVDGRWSMVDSSASKPFDKLNVTTEWEQRLMGTAFDG